MVRLAGILLRQTPARKNGRIARGGREDCDHSADLSLVEERQKEDGLGRSPAGASLRKASEAGGGEDPLARVAHGGTLAPQEWGCLSVLGERSLCDSPPRIDSGTGFGAQYPGPWAKGGPVRGSDRHTVPAAHTTVDRWMQRAHGRGRKCQGSSMHHHQCTTVSRHPCAPEAATPGGTVTLPVCAPLGTAQ